MSRMKIGVFAYNFHHWKTQAGIQNLIYAGYKPDAIFAADKVKLNFYQSKIRTTPRDLYLIHPKEIAAHYNIKYYTHPHNSEETSKLIRNSGLDLGIILGARILKPSAFSHFTKGVMNMHPGILPDNRGLDTIKWAIVNGLPQGVTTHIIDNKIDRGLLIEKEKISLYEDDTLLDIQIRIQNLEQKMMISSLKILETKNVRSLNNIEAGAYNKSMPLSLEQNLEEEFVKYKRTYIKK